MNDLACDWCGRWYSADDGDDEIFCSPSCRRADAAAADDPDEIGQVTA